MPDTNIIEARLIPCIESNPYVVSSTAALAQMVLVGRKRIDGDQADLLGFAWDDEYACPTFSVAIHLETIEGEENLQQRRRGEVGDPGTRALVRFLFMEPGSTDVSFYYAWTCDGTDLTTNAPELPQFGRQLIIN